MQIKDKKEEELLYKSILTEKSDDLYNIFVDLPDDPEGVELKQEIDPETEAQVRKIFSEIAEDLKNAFDDLQSDATSISKNIERCLSRAEESIDRLKESK